MTRSWLIKSRRSSSWFKRWIVFLTALYIAALVVFSIVPSGYRPRLPSITLPELEHFLAYLVLGGLAVLSAPRSARSVTIIGALIACAGLIEIVQIAIPSRVASLTDFAAGASGAVVGVAMAVLALRKARIKRAGPSRTREQLVLASDGRDQNPRSVVLPPSDVRH
jgi:VanZ family protein